MPFEIIQNLETSTITLYYRRRQQQEWKLLQDVLQEIRILLMTARCDKKHLQLVSMPWHQHQQQQQQQEHDEDGNDINNNVMYQIATFLKTLQDHQLSLSSITITEEMLPEGPLPDITTQNVGWGAATRHLRLQHVSFIGSQFHLEGTGIERFEVCNSSLDFQAGRDLARVLLAEQQQQLSGGNLKQLDLQWLNWNDDSFTQVSNSICHHATVTSLDLQGCCLTDDEMAVVLNDPPVHLESLNLSHNYCGSQTTHGLCQLLLLQSPSLSQLYLNGCQESSSSRNSFDWSLLCPALANNKSLKVLEMRLKNFEEEQIAMLIRQVLVHHPTLESLHLEGNDDAMTDQALHVLADHLPDIQVLRHLYLSNNSNFHGNQQRLSTEEAAEGPSSLLSVRRHLASAMASNFCLETLALFPPATALPTNFGIDLSGNMGMMREEKFGGNCAQNMIQYYLDRNWAGFGRVVLSTTTRVAFPVGLWPLVLERINHQYPSRQRKYEHCPSSFFLSRADVLFSFISQGQLLK